MERQGTDLRALRSNSLATAAAVVFVLAGAETTGAQDGVAVAPAETASAGVEPGREPVTPDAGGVAEDEAAPLPPLTVRDDGYRSEVEAAWFSGGVDPTRRAQNARVRALQLGATNYESAARALLAGDAEGAVRLERALMAVRLAPDLPMARMELASAQLDEGEYGAAFSEVVAGVRAIPNNLEALFWLAASLLAMFAAVLTVGSMAFIVWVGAGAFRHAAHDLGDLVSREMPDFARAALLGTVLLVPVVLGEALMGVVLGLFVIGFLYCEAGYRRALAIAAVLLVVGLYPMTRFAGTALTALDSDPIATAAHAVASGSSSPADIELLGRSADEDWLAEAALALHERRSGSRDGALARYERLLEVTPRDPVVLANLSNLHFERGEYERAIQLGERAAAVVRSATLLFNLSQVYARSFRMDEFEGAMAQAQLVDAAAVADLSRTAAPDFVADLAFPIAPIRDRLVHAADGGRFVAPVSRAVSPGYLGESWMHTAGGFLMAALMALAARGRWEHSSCCRRCGKRVCNRCDGSVWNSQICDGCHHLFHRPETTDPAMRMARLGELRQREARLGRIALAASLLVPGAGGLLARRPDLSFLGLFFFAWAAVLFLWRDGIVSDPLAIGVAGPLLFAIAGVVAVLGYVGVVSMSLMIRRSL